MTESGLLSLNWNTSLFNNFTVGLQVQAKMSGLIIEHRWWMMKMECAQPANDKSYLGIMMACKLACFLTAPKLFEPRSNVTVVCWVWEEHSSCQSQRQKLICSQSTDQWQRCSVNLLMTLRILLCSRWSCSMWMLQSSGEASPPYPVKPPHVTLSPPFLPLPSPRPPTQRPKVRHVTWVISMAHIWIQDSSCLFLAPLRKREGSNLIPLAWDVRCLVHPCLATSFRVTARHSV